MNEPANEDQMKHHSFRSLAAANRLGLLAAVGLEVVAGNSVLERLELPEELNEVAFSQDDQILFGLLESCHSSVEIFTAEPSEPHGVRAMLFVNDDLGVFASPAHDGWDFSAVFRLSPFMDRLASEIASENADEGVDDAFVYPVDEFANLIAIRSELLSGGREAGESAPVGESAGDSIDLDRIVLGKIITLSRSRIVRGDSGFADSMLGALAGERVRFIGQPNQMFYANPLGDEQFLLHRLEAESVRALLELTLGTDFEPPILPVNAPDETTVNALEQGGESVSFEEISVSYLNNIGVSLLEADLESRDCPPWKRALLAPEIVVSLESTGSDGQGNPTKYISIAGSTAVRWVQVRGVTQCDHFSVAQVKDLIGGWLTDYIASEHTLPRATEFSLSSSEYRDATKTLPQALRSLDELIPERARERGIISLVYLAPDGMVRGDEIEVLLLDGVGGFLAVGEPQGTREFSRASEAVLFGGIFDSLLSQPT